MALTEQVILDIQSAERQISVLESQLAQLGTPVNVPVNVTGEGDLAQVRQQLGQSEDAVQALNRELNQTDDAMDRVGREADTAADAIDRAGRGGSSAFSSLRGALVGVGAALVAIQGARVAFDFAGDAIESASQLEQSLGAVDAVFGELGGSVRAFGETADQSVGLAASQFNQLASLLGSQLQTFGFSASAAAAETQNLIVLASDLAATFGGPVSDAVEAISSLLRGEVNPIERYGVAMNETLVAAQALELGLAGTTSELTLQDRTLARLAILMEQTANAQGQFARESDTTAGRLERIRAQFENTRAEIGEALIPAFERLLDLTPALVQAFEDGVVPALRSFTSAMAEADTTGFARSIAGLPSALSTVGGDIASVGSIAREVFGGFIDLVGLDVPAAFARAEAAAAEFDEIGQRGATNQAIQNLLTTLETGRPALESVADVFATLSDTTLPVAQMGALAGRLAQIAGLDFEDLGELRDFIEEFGGQLGFTPEEIDAAVDAISELRREILGVGDDAVESGRKGRGFADDLLAIGDAAAITPSRLAGIEEGLAGLRSTAEGFNFDNVSTAFSEALPDALNAAQQALRTEEGEIVADFETFLANLQETLAAQVSFDRNLDLLESMGLDNLAEVFREAGLPSAPALADGLNDPAALRQAEADLDAAARTMAEFEAAAFGRHVRDFVEQFDPIEMPIVPVLGPLDIAAIQRQVQSGGINVPAAVIGAETGVTVNQTFTSPETSSTDRARAIQSVNGIISAPRVG